MNTKLEKYTEERRKILSRIAALEERRKALDAKIMEAENLEIRAMMRSKNLSLAELMELVRAMQENYGTDPEDLLVAVGPAIDPEHFEVGKEVVDAVRPHAVKPERFWQEVERRLDHAVHTDEGPTGGR